MTEKNQELKKKNEDGVIIKNVFEERYNKNYVSLGYQSEQEFRIVAETLTRMGEYDKETNSLIQQVWIIKKRGITYLAHYKQILDMVMEPKDYAVINTTAEYLKSFGLITFVRNFYFLKKYGISANFKVISKKDEEKYNLVSMVSNSQIKYFLDNIFDKPLDVSEEINYNK